MIYHTDCKVCGGSGYLLNVNDGYETIYECECIQPVRAQRYLLNSGIRYKEYAEKNFDTFREDTEEAKKNETFGKAVYKRWQCNRYGFFRKARDGKNSYLYRSLSGDHKETIYPAFLFFVPEGDTTAKGGILQHGRV